MKKYDFQMWALMHGRENPKESGFSKIVAVHDECSQKLHEQGKEEAFMPVTVGSILKAVDVGNLPMYCHVCGELTKVNRDI